MKLIEIRKKYKAKGVHFQERWCIGFIVTGKSEKHIREILEPVFIVRGIGIGPKLMNDNYN